EVDSLKIEDDFAHPIRADGFQRSVELRRAVQVHLPAEKQHAALAPACDLDLKHLPSTPATVLVPVRDAPAVPRSLPRSPGRSPLRRACYPGCRPRKRAVMPSLALQRRLQIRRYTPPVFVWLLAQGNSVL